MNKQEAIEKIKKQSTQACDDFAIMRDTAIHIINQIDEPQKPVVPKFVAEWIEECKSDNKWLMYALCKPNFENNLFLSILRDLSGLRSLYSFFRSDEEEDGLRRSGTAATNLENSLAMLGLALLLLVKNCLTTANGGLEMAWLLIAWKIAVEKRKE